MELDTQKVEQLCKEVESRLHAVPGRSESQLAMTSFRDLGMDSLAKIRLVSALEERFQITIHDEEALFADSVEQLVLLVREKIAVRPP